MNAREAPFVALIVTMVVIVIGGTMVDRRAVLEWLDELGRSTGVPAELRPGSPGSELTLTPEDARTLTLSGLEMGPEVATPYDREEAFPHWRDAESNGWSDLPAENCDAREAALARDGGQVTVDTDTCEAVDGTWSDPYTGEVIHDSRDVDVDHHVSLSSAWAAGAASWDENKREAYANDPLVVVATSATVNRSKSDLGPSEWKPEDRSTWCAYAVRWVEIKDTYDLALQSKAERAALLDMLATC